MRRYYLITIIFFSFTLQIFPQDWFWQNPIPTSNSLYGVKFLNDSIAYCVGNGGFMMKSTDAGLTWESINSNTSLFLTDIFYIDEYNFIAAGLEGTIIKSFDGGITWQVISSGVGYIFNDIFFVDTDIGWISGSNNSHFGMILKSTDGGNVWEVIISGFHGRLISIHFFDPNNGLVIDYYGMYSTTDGGINWNGISSGYSGFRKMLFISSSNGFIIGDNGLIIKTTDGGNTWEQKNSGTNITLRAIDFKDENNGIVVGLDGVVLVTTDAGESWENISSQYDYFDDLYAISINNDGITLLGGIRGELVRSADSGTTWNRIRQGYLNHLNAIYMLNKEKGWVVGDEGIILRTTNGGDNWNRADSITNKNLRDVLFISDSIGWIVGDSGNVFKTYNYGQSWEPVYQFGSIDINSIFFVNKNIGWIAGSNGSIYNTTDSGILWTLQMTNTTRELISIFFSDENNGWCIKSHWPGDPVLLKTTNGGFIWESVTGVWLPVYSIHFVDSSTGWTVGGGTEYSNLDYGQVYNTTNSGLTWQRYLYGYGDEWGYRFFDVHFLDFQRGWIFGRILGPRGNHREGVVAYTTDGGESLIFQRSSTANPLVSASIIDETQIWVVGKYGTILITTNGGVSFVEEEEIDDIPTNYNLSQNYPNPFNPITTIKYQIPELSFVTLKVFDVLGSEVVILVSEEKPTGNYEIELNASSLSSGIYFYRLQAGSFIETRKMVLLR